MSQQEIQNQNQNQTQTQTPTQNQKEFLTILHQRINRFRFLVQYAKLDLKEYQVEGVEWCLRCELRPDPLEKIRGGIISDEMGLGKTIMMIGTMFSNIVERTLIVVPPILIEQWKKEIFRITGHQALVYYGKHKKEISMETLLKARIVITSYNAIAISKKRMQLDIVHQVLWSRVLYDEAHHLRNKKTTRFLGCKNIRAKIRWFITGTPIQNRTADIYSLFNALGFPTSFYMQVENVVAIRQHYMLRRTKKKVGLLLEDVSEETCVVPWSSPMEKALSQEIHSLIRMCNISSNSNSNSSSISKKCTFASILDMERGNGNSVLVPILRAKQSCIMGGLMKEKVLSLIEKGTLDQSYLDPMKYQSKLEAVIDKIVERKDNKKGKLVFCHYVGEIDYIARNLLDNGLSVMVYKGKGKGKGKKKLLEKVDVLILQIQSGCEGLNLQEHYSEVYFVSPHWNPSIEDQAVARCHRIGQQQQVEVFRFIMDTFDPEAKTIENYVQFVQENKRTMINEIQE